MNQKKKFGLAVCMALASSSCFSEEMKLGDISITYRQTCGKSIELSIAKAKSPHSGHLILGLKNNTSGKVDLFISKTATAEHMQYEQYHKVFFDNLSKSFVKSSENVSFVWGAAQMNLQKAAEFSLAFGSYVYLCKDLEKVSDENANTLYGELYGS